ncbi:helix-turn-helix domain-containing protein [bacterium]|nr:helix-turn-helix domain-containing protein [bacterium]
MEVTAQLFRALANPVRMRMLRVVGVLGEQTVTQLAGAVRVEPHDVSYHVHILAMSGVLWRRRSGAFVYYRLAEEPSNEVTRAALSLLRGVFQDVRETDPRRVAECEKNGASGHSDDSLIECFTAFTHPRRLQIIRHLSKGDASDMSSVAEALRMSLSACSRHMAKLERRKLVKLGRAGGARICESARSGNDAVTALLAAVLHSMQVPQQ